MRFPYSFLGNRFRSSAATSRYPVRQDLHTCRAGEDYPFFSPENRFTLFGMRFERPRILSENRFTLFGMRFEYPRILSENRFTLFGMRGVHGVKIRKNDQA